MKSLKALGLSILALTIVVTNNDALSQKKKKKKSDEEYYTVPRSEYMMLENGKIYPIEDYSSEYDYTSEEWITLNPNYTLPDKIESENYIISITEGESFELKTITLSGQSSQLLDKKMLNDEKRFGSYFSKNDTTIVLKLANGLTKSYYYPSFLDSLTPTMMLLQQYEVKQRWHYFEGYLKHIDAYLVYWVENTSFYETREGYQLVSAKDGSEILWGGTFFNEFMINEIPLISPNNKQILFINKTGIRLYSIENGHFKEEINTLFFDENNEWYGDIIDRKWETDNSFLIYTNGYDHNYEYIEQFKRITIEKK